MTGTMKLYNLRLGMWFVWSGIRLEFVKPDGMYAICRDQFGAERWLSMAADVEVQK